jgi:hypothetical protein
MVDTGSDYRPFLRVEIVDDERPAVAYGAGVTGMVFAPFLASVVYEF